MSFSEILAFNPMLKTIRHILPGATDPDDCYSYPLVAPPQIRPDTERRPVYSGSFLCHVCHGALEYLAYVLEECRSKRSTADDLNLLEVAAHYQNVAAWLENNDGDCHLCYFLLRLVSRRGPPDLDECLSDTRLELSWNSKFAEVGDQEDFKRGRLYVALTKLSLERTQANYYNSMRLQIWPAKDYAHLFLALSKPHSASLSSSKSSDDASYADTHDISNDIDSGSPLLDSSSDGNNNHDDDRNDNDEDNDSDDDSYNAEGASNAKGSDSNGYDGDGYDSDGSDDGFDKAHPGKRSVTVDADSTGSQFSQELVAQWLARCQNNEDGQHLECNRTEENWLPTRLIDVNFTSENPVLRLASPVETPEIFEADRRYITLNHCWGE